MKQRSYYLLWPVRFGWLWRPLGRDTTWRDWRYVFGLGWHGWYVDGKGEVSVFGQTFHVGPLKIMCGPAREKGRGSERQRPPGPPDVPRPKGYHPWA